MVDSIKRGMKRLWTAAICHIGAGEPDQKTAENSHC